MRLIAFCFLLSACSMSQNQSEEIREYYNLDSLVNAQVKLISDRNYRLEKKVILNMKQEDTVLNFGNEEWINEFKLFNEADLNVPSNSGMYNFTKGLSDPTSNLLYDQYLPKNGFQPSVLSLEIYYFNTIDQVKKVKIYEAEDNDLYFSFKRLELNFSNEEGQSRLVSYSVAGIQKLLSRDSVIYQINGRILID